MKYIKTIFIVIGIISLILIFCPISGKLDQPSELSPSLRDTLIKLAVKAAQNGDVPVSSVLTYNDLIIGAAYNDVLSGNNAAGHAEINAISKAIQQFGFIKFMQLDRKKLRLITTFEPCAMCRGAIAQYQIHDIKVLQYKSLKTHWKDWLQSIRAYYNSRPVDADHLQDSLFRLHPGFDPEKAVY